MAAMNFGQREVEIYLRMTATFIWRRGERFLTVSWPNLGLAACLENWKRRWENCSDFTWNQFWRIQFQKLSFSTRKILREITFAYFRVSKTVIFNQWDFTWNHFWRIQSLKNVHFQPIRFLCEITFAKFWVSKNVHFQSVRFSKISF